MTSLIHKYCLGCTPGQINVTMPASARILSVQPQHDAITIWAEHRAGDTETRERHFCIFPTGRELTYPAGGEIVYLNTVSLFDGDLVFHLYEWRENYPRPRSKPIKITDYPEGLYL